MSNRKGWFRLWFVFGIAALAFATWSAFQGSTVLAEYAGSCLPRTLQIETDYDRVREPTESEILKAKAELRDSMEKSGVGWIEHPTNDFAAKVAAQREIEHAAEYKVCIPTWRLGEQLGIAALITALLFPLFLIGRWVLTGFKAQVS